MLRICLLLYILCVSLFVHSQTLTITDNSGKALEMVTIVSENSSAFITTNTEGQADISALKGMGKIHIRSLGYKTFVTNFAQLESRNFKVVMTPLNITIDEVIISAVKWRRTGGDVPSKVVAISPEEVKLQNPQTAADLLSVSGKVFVQKSQQGGGSPMIRGFATNRLLYTIDGVRMNTAIFRGGNVQNVISLDPFAIEHTEVLFGPGSVIYGSDAIGGVMAFQTLTPQLSLTDKPLIKGKAVARYSSANNEKTGHFDVNVGWQKWAFITSFSSYHFGDLKMGSHGPDEYLRHWYVERHDDRDIVVNNDDPRIQRPSGYSQMNLMQKVRYKPNNSWDVEYGFHYSETSDYARYDRHIMEKNGMPRYGEWYYGPQKWMMNNLSITHNDQNLLYDRLSVKLAHQLFEESRISRDFNEPEREKRIEEVTALSANIDLMKSLSSTNSIFYGVEIVENKVHSTGINEIILTGMQEPGPPRYPESSWSSYGIYITDQIKIANKHMLQAGLRYNQFIIDARFDTAFYPFPFTTAYINNGALSGSLGFIYRPSNKWAIRTNVATAFRSPNIDDMGKVFDPEPGTVIVPNPGLQAEYAYNADIGIARVFGEILKLDFSVYYTLLENAIVRRDFMLNDRDSIMYDGEMSRVQALQNAAVANVYGLQAGMEVNLPGKFRFASDFNYQKGWEEMEGESRSPTRHAPPWFGQSKLIYSHDRLQLEIYTLYGGEKSFEDMPEEEKGKTEIYAIDENGNPYSPGWYTLNFKAMYRFRNNFSIATGLENITDQRYRTYSSGIVAPGRNFILSLRAEF